MHHFVGNKIIRCEDQQDKRGSRQDLFPTNISDQPARNQQKHNDGQWLRKKAEYLGKDKEHSTFSSARGWRCCLVRRRSFSILRNTMRSRAQWSSTRSRRC